MTWDVAIIGSGFAGALLARLLAVQGRRVMLIERDTHPRFALGESSTPLAALSLERLARRYRQPDLHHLAAYGRWQRHLAGLGHGLKRGFTFYRHRPRGVGDAGATCTDRMLVAASPDDEVADCQWLRSDVDTHLVTQAIRTGVVYHDRTEIEEIEPSPDAVRLRGQRGQDRLEVRARFVVDASGAGEVVARSLGVGSHPRQPRFSSRLVYAHFDGVTPLEDVMSRFGRPSPPGPYPDDWAAVHHLLDEGWIYGLRFRDGVVSAGLLADGGDHRSAIPEPRSAQTWWETVIGRYPALDAAWQGARARPPGVGMTPWLQRRREYATGDRWAMLPQSFAFYDPMFSTGIAWSLLGVERLAQVLGTGGIDLARLARYETLLQAEADQQLALLEAAYTSRPDFPVFRNVTFLYFACVSYAELRQRLVGDTRVGDAWRGFLGAEDPHWTTLFGQARAQAAATLADGTESARRWFTQWVSDGIRAHNLIGLGESDTQLYGVDLDLLVQRSALLGLSAKELKARLGRLRGR
ncbi:MAG: FAD-dependent oxidoreductase [Acidobacteriota bacterium]|nr:FAD-dependent oxidoreductase [Acidobacteriota bacterium]